MVLLKLIYDYGSYADADETLAAVPYQANTVTLHHVSATESGEGLNGSVV